jgi:hypothetical protein
MEQEIDTPVEVLEVYDIIEKLLHPNERIYQVNPQVSKIIEMLLTDLYNHQPEEDGNRNYIQTYA